MVNPKLIQSLREMSTLICLFDKKDKRIEASSVNFLSKFIGFGL